MKRSNRKIHLAGFTLACACAGLVAGASAQTPVTGRGARALAAVGQVIPEPAVPFGGVLTNRPDDEKAIKLVAATFTRAFNAGDAKTAANLYTADAEMIDELGERIEGRSAILAFYSALFAERKGATIEIFMSSLRFLGPDVAKEEGQTRVKPAGGAPATLLEYTVLYVKQGSQWLYSSVRERHAAGLAHHERLKELDWMLGEWVDESSNSIIHTTCRWSDDKNYLLRDFVINAEGRPVMNVTQRIGWDPLTRQIKSWVFDSDGGHAQALWARDGNRWIIKSAGVLPDGRPATSTNILTRTGPNTARWASTERTVAGEVIPDHGESVWVRKPPRPEPALRLSK